MASIVDQHVFVEMSPQASTTTPPPYYPPSSSSHESYNQQQQQQQQQQDDYYPPDPSANQPQRQQQQQNGFHGSQNLYTAGSPGNNCETSGEYKVVFDQLSFTVQAEDKAAASTMSPFARMFCDAPFVPKTILHNITGICRPGRLTAVMGPSGAGKTTLLNLLAGKTSSGTVGGAITLNGAPITGTQMRQVSGFVFQDDVILATQTVREAISMSAKLRLPQTMTPEELEQRVDLVVSMLGLEACQNSVIGAGGSGGEGSGISGGERKRTSVAMELITNPAILFLDEPTTGLDAFTACAVIGILKMLASAGRTVIATIHQPSSEVFHMFDDLVLLVGGQVMYCGPIEECVDYFGKCGYPCPKYTNPADHMFMNILNDNEADPHEKDGSMMLSKEERTADLLDKWATSEELFEVKRLIAEDGPSTGLEGLQMKILAPIGVQFSLLSARTFRNMLRDKLMLRGRFIQTLFMAVLLGLIYLQLGNIQRNIQDREGVLFFMGVNCVMANAMGVLAVFHEEKRVFLREHINGFYSTFPYFLSKIITELPFLIVLPFIFATICYWMIGLQADGTKFITTAITIVLLSNVGSAVGIFSTCLVDTLPMALTVVPMFLLPILVFSGFFVNGDSIPAYFNWIQYISPVKYAFVVFATNEFSGLTFTCDPSLSSCITTGTQVLSNLNMLTGQLSIGLNILVIICMYFGLVLLAFFALWRSVKAVAH